MLVHKHLVVNCDGAEKTMIGRIWNRIKAITGRAQAPADIRPTRSSVHTGSREIERRLRQQARREQKKEK